MATPDLVTVDLNPDAALETGLITKAQTAPLLLYVSEASLLPTDEESYRLELGVTATEFTEMKNQPSLEISQIMETQRNIRRHCSDFNDNEYPNMVNLAALLTDYAEKVGPPLESSFYANLVDQARKRDAAIKAMVVKGIDNTEKTEQKDIADEATGNLQGILSALIVDANKLLKDSQDVVAKLKEFETQCKEDSKELNLEQQRNKDALTGEEGLLKHVEVDLKDLHGKWHDAYVKFCVATTAAATSFLWLGLPVLGYIIFPIAAGVGGAEAKALHDQMDDIDRKIERDNFEIAQYKKLMFNIGLVAKKIDYLSQIIQPAIRVIQVFEGVWTAIVADLTAVQNALSKDSVNEEAGKKITALLLNLNVESIMKKWKKVGERADAFRLSAYITDGKPNPEMKTFEEVRDLIKKHYPS